MLNPNLEVARDVLESLKDRNGYSLKKVTNHLDPPLAIGIDGCNHC